MMPILTPPNHQSAQLSQILKTAEIFLNPPENVSGNERRYIRRKKESHPRFDTTKE